MSYQSFSYFYGKGLWNEYLTCESRYYSLQRAGIVTPWSLCQTVPVLWSGGILLGGHAVLSSGRWEIVDGNTLGPHPRCMSVMEHSWKQVWNGP